LIKHRDAHASATEDLTLSKPKSVVSRRSMVGIARAAGASPRQLEQAAGADPPRSMAGAPRPAANPPRSTAKPA
jgi:hypothetical protein